MRKCVQKLGREVRRSALLALVWCATVGCAAPRLAIEPIPIQDDDRYDIPEPTERERDDYYDVLDYTIYTQVEQMLDVPRGVRKLAHKPKQALNVTPLDEIQDSTWFENRIGVRDMTPADVRRGPNDPQGPDLSGPWTIVAAKTQGVTPGFTIQDARGDRFVIKFDPAREPEIATAAEAISTRFFWAMGYHVPQNYLVRFDASILRIDPGARVREGYKKRSMTKADLEKILSNVPRNPDGSLRAIASRFIAGKPIGPPSWAGRRKDDPNDVIPHEHRRELRAYRVFCSWLHHNDSREINAADFYVEDEGRRFVRHYLIDFGATLGSRSYTANLRSEGFEYVFDLGEMALSLASAGLYERGWTRLRYPELRGVGRFEAEHFDPGDWKPDYPNPAFENITPQDGFWAAKIVMRFSDPLIRAAVEAGGFTDPHSTEYVIGVLRERRDRVGHYWFSKVNPLDRFEVVGQSGDARLRFVDLGVRHGFEPPRSYQVIVIAPNHETWVSETSTPEVGLSHALETFSSAADNDVRARLLRVRLRSRVGDTWSPAVETVLYLEPSGTLRLVRVQRDS